jgi:hypothetical protein
MYTEGGLVNPEGVTERVENGHGAYGCHFSVQLLLALLDGEILIDDYQYSTTLKLLYDGRTNHRPLVNDTCSQSLLCSTPASLSIFA